MAETPPRRDAGYPYRLAALLAALATVGALTYLGSPTGAEAIRDWISVEGGGPGAGLVTLSRFVGLFSAVLFVGGGLTLALLLKAIAVSRRSSGLDPTAGSDRAAKRESESIGT